MTEATWVVGWMDRGRRTVAVALRGAAQLLEGLADTLDPIIVRTPLPADEPPLPRAGTRERIAATLERARARYDAVTLPAAASGRRPGRPPRSR